MENNRVRYIIIQWEGEWRLVGYPQMKYLNMFIDKSKALDVAWGMYEGYNEEQVRRHKMQARPRGWRLPSIMRVIEIEIPGAPFGETLTKEYMR